MKKLFASMLVVSALAITGCGGSDTTGTAPAEPQATPPAAEEGTEAPPAETPAETPAQPTNP
jgi:hypothetical protein